MGPLTAHERESNLRGSNYKLSGILLGDDQNSLYFYPISLAANLTVTFSIFIKNCRIDIFCKKPLENLQKIIIKNS